MGHAVYSLSDPRANDLQGTFVERLSEEKGRDEEYAALRRSWSGLPPEVIAEERKIYKGVSANVDFYSGFVYSMLDLPHGAVHPDFRHRPHRGLERPPAWRS